MEDKQASVALLNRLLAILCRSLPQYLRWSRPHVAPGETGVLETLGGIANDEDVLAQRVGAMIVDARALPRTGEFPMEFTDFHDLGLNFLVAAATRYQRQNAADIQQVVDRSESLPAVRAIAEEALGMAKGHLDALLELASPVTAK